MKLINGSHPRFKPLMEEIKQLEKEIEEMAKTPYPDLPFDYTPEEFQDYLDKLDARMEPIRKHLGAWGELSNLGWDNLDE